MTEQSSNEITGDAAIGRRAAAWQRSTKLHRINVDEAHSKQVVVDKHLSNSR